MNPSLPKLTVNRSFIAEFIDADAPCVAMGMIQEAGLRTLVKDIIPDSLFGLILLDIAV